MASETIRISKEMVILLKRLKPALFGVKETDQSVTYDDIIRYLYEHSAGTQIVFMQQFDELIKTAKIIDGGKDPEHPHLLELFQTMYVRAGRSKKEVRLLNSFLVEYATGIRMPVEDDPRVDEPKKEPDAPKITPMKPVVRPQPAKDGATDANSGSN